MDNDSVSSTQLEVSATTLQFNSSSMLKGSIALESATFGANLRNELKLQLEAFFSCVILRLAQGKYGPSYQQQEVAMEALVNFCGQKSFMVEMYANLDCDITGSNVFEELSNLLSKSIFHVNCPLSAMHILALDGLIDVIHGMAERISNGLTGLDLGHVHLDEYTSFWMVKCDNYSDPNQWVSFVRKRKYIKRRLMIGADHFNRDPKKGLDFLQWTHLLPDKLDTQSVACFFRYIDGLDKNLVGDFLGNHDELCVQVLNEFAGTFDFEYMNWDTALRLFLETFRLPREYQKIQGVLEAFSERYYMQSHEILANKDNALVLSYSIIMLNTDQHNVQVKKKMTEEDFIRNNRHINGGNDLPREFLSELYHSICNNEIRTTPEQGVGFSEMTPSRWIDLMVQRESFEAHMEHESSVLHKKAKLEYSKVLDDLKMLRSTLEVEQQKRKEQDKKNLQDKLAQFEAVYKAEKLQEISAHLMFEHVKLLFMITYPDISHLWHRWRHKEIHEKTVMLLNLLHSIGSSEIAHIFVKAVARMFGYTPMKTAGTSFQKALRVISEEIHISMVLNPTILATNHVKINSLTTAVRFNRTRAEEIQIHAHFFLVGVGMNMTHSRTSPQTNRIWDPSGLFDMDEATWVFSSCL